MAKKPKPIAPDADGVLRRGIYERSIRKQRNGTHEDWETLQRHCDYWENCSFFEHLVRIRRALRPLVEPFLERMADRADFDEKRQSLPGTYGCLNIGDGSVCYRQIPEIQDGSTEAEIALDAIKALREVDYVEAAITRHPELQEKHSHRVFMDTLRLGIILDRINVRPFEEDVVKGRGAVTRAQNAREAKRTKDCEKRVEKHKRAVAAMEWAREAFPTAAYDDYIGFLKDKAAEHLGISRDTLERWLKPLDE